MTARIVPLIAVTAAAATLITGLGTVAHVATAVETTSSPGGGLIVSPGSALFDVALELGVPEAAELTMTNTSTTDLDVQLSIALSDGAPTDHRLDHLELHATSDYTSCDASVLEGASTITFAETQRIDQEAVPAGTARTVCIGVVLPADSPQMEAATTVVDFQFRAIDAGGDPGGSSGDLPFTGFDGLRLLPMAFLALVTGVLACWAARRREADSTEH